MTLCAISLTALTGCETVEGFKSDISKGFSVIGDSVAAIAAPVDPVKEAKKKLPVYDGTCPTVTVRPDLARLVEFYNADKPADATKISQAEILTVENICRVENNMLVLQIDMSIAGKTGPKARVKSTDKPSFAYPYFVAVTDATGIVLAKEIFAATIAYGANQNELKQTESIFQTMPFPDATIGQTYNVVVGFQLSPEQLAYNAAHPQTTTP